MKIMLKNNTNKQGFTIIEVVLVLAIAGLIFLTVFLALPALQRSQRDSQRKRDMGLFTTAWTNNFVNNQSRSSLYLTVEERYNSLIRNGYIKEDEFIDPSTGVRYVGKVFGTLEAYSETNLRDLKVGEFIMDFSVEGCDGDKIIDSPHNNPTIGLRSVAIVTRLEGGGLYCASNV